MFQDIGKSKQASGFGFAHVPLLMLALTGGARETSSEDGASLGRIGDGLADQVLKRLQPSALFGEAFFRLGCHLHPR